MYPEKSEALAAFERLRIKAKQRRLSLPADLSDCRSEEENDLEILNQFISDLVNRVEMHTR